MKKPHATALTLPHPRSDEQGAAFEASAIAVTRSRLDALPDRERSQAAFGDIVGEST